MNEIRIEFASQPQRSPMEILEDKVFALGKLLEIQGEHLIKHDREIEVIKNAVTINRHN